MNVDDNMATSAKYQILSIPTLLVFKGGEVVKTVVGSLPKQRLTGELEPWLGSAVASSVVPLAWLIDGPSRSPQP